MRFSQTNFDKLRGFNLMMKIKDKVSIPKLKVSGCCRCYSVPLFPSVYKESVPGRKQNPKGSAEVNRRPYYPDGRTFQY